MPEVVSISQNAPEPGKNVIASDRGVQAVNDTVEKRNLRSAIKRINRIREKTKSIQKEGKRIGDAIQERGNTIAELGAARSKQLQGTVDEAVKAVQESSAQKNSLKTNLIEAISSTNIEIGKGEKLNNSI